ncbi:MAG TPA: hypothetical protein VKA59_10510, partial [Vicinamibacterales bacterium]|nr:hypothetical protein [Vicinamibacterales bacterium]
MDKEDGERSGQERAVKRFVHRHDTLDAELFPDTAACGLRDGPVTVGVGQKCDGAVRHFIFTIEWVKEPADAVL